MLIHEKIFPPVIKWSGSKRKIAKKLSAFIPECKRYFEPFVGSGALLPFRKISTGFAGDIISELIMLWQAIKNEPEKIACEYQKRWELLQNKGHTVFYEIRDKFNISKDIHDFLFLTRTCVNGLIRYNSKGEFNNSFHITRSGINPVRLRDIIYKWHFVINNIDFFHCDYLELTAMTKKNDFIFFDPPYMGTKGRYLQGTFDMKDFISELDRLNSIGVKWMLTFDGYAGKRFYNYTIPKELYLKKIFVKTGSSPFTRLMNTGIDEVSESVYFNYTPITEFSTARTDNFHKESSLLITA